MQLNTHLHSFVDPADALELSSNKERKIADMRKIKDMLKTTAKVHEYSAMQLFVIISAFDFQAYSPVYGGGGCRGCRVHYDADFSG